LEKPTVIPGEYLLVLKSGSIGLATTPKGLQVLDTFNINGWRAIHVKVEDSVLAALTEDANVDYIQANAREFRVDCEPQETGSRLWGLSRTSSRALPDYSSAQYFVDDNDGNGVNVYILDTGIRITHNDFGGRASYGFVAPGLVGEGPGDLHGHGTHCGGTAGGTEFGVAKACAVIEVKVMSRFGSGSTTDIVAGINYVTDEHNSGSAKKSVMNLSLGASGSNSAMENAVQAAIDAGVHAAIAAGNSNADACNFTPARVGDALTVGATTSTDSMASFSNWGTCVDLIAPGSNILSASHTSDTGTATMSGTSMAAPHVAGWAARELSRYPDAGAPAPVPMKGVLQDAATTGAVNPPNNTPDFLIYHRCE
jgi:cerevisin